MFESRTGINSSDVIKMTQYNDNNTLVNNDNLIKIFKKGGIDRKPISVKIYQQSFIHKSYVKKKKTIIIKKVWNMTFVLVIV